MYNLDKRSLKKTVILVFSILVLLVSTYLVNKIVKSSTHKADLKTFDEHYLSSDTMKADFNYLVEKILEVHPDPQRNFNGNWDQLIHEMEKDFDKPMPVMEYAMKLMSFTSQLNDAHTEVYPLNVESKQLPVNFEWVKEGLVISESYEDHLEIGDLVIKIGNHSTDEIFRLMDKFISSENEFWLKVKGKNFLRHEIFLKQLSLINDDSVTLTVERDDTLLEIDVVLVSKEDMQLLKANEERPWFSWEIKQDLNIGYFNIEESRISDEYEEEVSVFFEEVNKASIDNVVIDLRLNSGGTSEVMDPFLKHLPIDSISTSLGVIKYSKEASMQRGYPQTTGLETFLSQYTHLRQDFIYKGNIYILTSPATYSSGSMFAVLFHDSNLATIVGEPTGNSPSSFGDTIQLELPYTKFTLLISHKEFRRPDLSLKAENTLHPNILVEKTQADITSRKDRQLERILQIISDKN